jgi:hypothetical protein
VSTAGHRAAGRQGRVAVLAVALAAAAAILAHALLLPLGAWRPDEYLQFALHDRQGWAEVTNRIFGWSPRPISEILLFLYSRLVAWQDGPGIVPVLAAAWAGTLAVLLVAARIARLGLAIPLAVFATALLFARPGEMWFWPAASLAYLPAFAGMGAAALLLLRPGPDSGGRHAALCGALLLAAGSVETGAVFVLLLAAAQLGRLAAARCIPRLAPLLAPAAPAWVWLLPALLAGGVALVMLQHRASVTTEIVLPGPTAGHLAASLLAALPDWLASVLGAQPEAGRPLRLAPGFAFKLLALAAFWALLPGNVSTSARLSSLLTALALLGAGFLSVAMAHRQFGLLCCERHEALRQGMVAIALLSVAAALPRSAAAGRLRSVVPWSLAAALGVALWLRLPALQADLALVDPVLRSRAANWVSGRAAGDTMAYQGEPVSRLAGGWGLPPGIHARPDHGAALPAGLHWHAFAILLFFDKLELRSP